MYDWRRMTESERKAALASRKFRQYPWHGPPHSAPGEGVYHLTAACYEHAPIIGLNADRLADFEQQLLDVVTEHTQSVAAWCVLPNHYHLLVETNALDALTSALGRLHGRLSFQWNNAEGRRGRKVWHRCADRAMRSDRHYWTTMNYVHHNPVHHRYVRRWQDWPFSSAPDFLAQVGAEKTREIWEAYPLLDYGRGWDDPSL